jgi:hypothetical protein
MNKKALIFLGLFFFSATDMRGQSVRPILIHRYEKGYGSHSLEDNVAYLVDSAGAGGRVAVRVCSQKRLPIALSIAAANPFVISTILKVDYSYLPERILYLRSDSCLGSDPMAAATELWAVPSGAVLPASVESVGANQARLESVGKKDLSAEGVRNYRTAVQELTAKLNAKPDATAVVLGYYYNKPHPMMAQRLREVQKLLKQNGLSQGRYFVRLAAWNGERSVDPLEPEPKYPSLFVVEVEEGCTRK